MIVLKNFKTFVYPTQRSRNSFVFKHKLIYKIVFADFRGSGDKIFTPICSLDKFLWVWHLSENYFPGIFTLINFSVDGVIFNVSKKNLLAIVNFFKYSWYFRSQELMDIFAVDFPSRVNRFELTYVLLSIRNNERIYLRSYVKEFVPVPSLSLLFHSANWLEREIWDMHGVPFGGNSDLRRILTDYGFFGHPLRKDFPLTGFFELRYDDTVRRVVSESVNLLQELRLFFFGTPWLVF